MDLATAPIAWLAPRIARGDLSPVEVVAAVLARIAELDGALHAYVTLDERGALSAAAVAEREIAAGRARGPLHGIPLGVKDNLSVAGMPVTNGSPAMQRTVAATDATAVSRLRAAGAVILGKHTMHEWAMGGTCTRTPGGPVRNPWDFARIPGGSSGGSAAAVSAGLAAGAIGTDGMGSIRTPASYCGIVGLKPTYGLVSRFGELPRTTAWNDHVGALARTVADVRLLLAVIAGPDPRDPTSRTAPGTVAATGSPPDPRTLRVGLLRTPLDGDIAPAIRAAVDATAGLLGGLGADVVEVSIPEIGRTGLAMPALANESQAALLPLALAGPDRFANDDIRARTLAAELALPADRRRAQAVAQDIRDAIEAALAFVDVLVLPTNTTAPFPIGAARWRVGSGESVALDLPGGQARVTTRLTMPFNLAGVPVISIPARDLVEGLPVGVQLVGRRWEDHRLLDIASLLEAHGAAWRMPPAAGG